MYKPGDKIRVLVDNADHADVSKGDEFIVKTFEPDGEKGFVEVHGNGECDWWFSFENIELVERA